jgi:hypothetical protein
MYSQSSSRASPWSNPTITLSNWEVMESTCLKQAVCKVDVLTTCLLTSFSDKRYWSNPCLRTAGHKNVQRWCPMVVHRSSKRSQVGLISRRRVWAASTSQKVVHVRLFGFSRNRDHPGMVQSKTAINPNNVALECSFFHTWLREGNIYIYPCPSDLSLCSLHYTPSHFLKNSYRDRWMFVKQCWKHWYNHPRV